MKIISFEDIKNLGITPKDCLEWTREALERKADAMLPPKISLKPPHLSGSFYNVMPTIAPALNIACVKLVTRLPHAEPALDGNLLLSDLATNSVSALMDATWITNARTGAVAAHSAALLGIPGFTRVGLIGLGNTARATLDCLRAAVPERHLEVTLLAYKGQEEGFQERFAAMPEVTFHVVDDVKELVAQSQVAFSCVTYTPEDFIDDDSAFAPGITLIPVHTRGFTQCDLTFDKVFCDDRGHLHNFKNYAAFEPRLTEVAEVVSGQKPGRTSDEERILVYNIGIALQDLVYAKHVYDAAKDLVPDVVYPRPQEKFWA